MFIYKPRRASIKTSEVPKLKSAAGRNSGVVVRIPTDGPRWHKMRLCKGARSQRDITGQGGETLHISTSSRMGKKERKIKIKIKSVYATALATIAITGRAHKQKSRFGFRIIR